MSKLIYLVLILFCISGCETKKKNVKPVKSSDVTDGLKKYYNKEGKLKTEVTILNGKRDGVAKTYYNGKVSLAMNYKAGRREGASKRYYRDGTIYQETFYKDDKMDGERKKYRENGTLMSSARYERDFPCSGLKEILQNGEVKDKYPSLIIMGNDRLKQEGVYKINLSLTAKVRSVNYYIGNLSATGCLPGSTITVETNSKKDIGIVRYNLPPGGFMMQELNFIAEIETVMGNTYITQKKFFVSIQN